MKRIYKGGVATDRFSGVHLLSSLLAVGIYTRVVGHTTCWSLLPIAIAADRSRVCVRAKSVLPCKNGA